MPPASADPTVDFEHDASADAGALFVNLTARYLALTRAAEGRVSTHRGPAELAARFAEPLPTGGSPLGDVVARLEREVLAEANHLYHPMYMGHQVSAPLPAAIWTESVIAALNNSLAVWEMSPTATAVENQVVRWMCELAGYGPRSGGTFTAGGTEATFSALLAARSVVLPRVWTDGVGSDPPLVLCGEHAHYAVTRAVGELGLGMRSAITVPSRGWSMDTAALDKRLDELAASGRRVMAVVATAGSTATGSFDDLQTIAASCERRGLWLHVDGAHGASALLSPAHRHRVRGIERAHSIAWDPHKMMLLPLAAGIVLVREERDLEAAFAQQAPYLFHGVEGARSPDQGVRSFLCSRRADALKLWVALQRYGADGIGALYDRLCATTAALAERLAEREDFMTLHEPESNILCFRWIGDGSLDDERLDAANRELRERYNRSGTGWITATTLDGRRVLRVTIMNPRTTREHVEKLVEGLAEEAKKMTTSD